MKSYSVTTRMKDVEQYVIAVVMLFVMLYNDVQRLGSEDKIPTRAH